MLREMPQEITLVSGGKGYPFPSSILKLSSVLAGLYEDTGDTKIPVLGEDSSLEKCQIFVNLFLSSEIFKDFEDFLLDKDLNKEQEAIWMKENLFVIQWVKDFMKLIDDMKILAPLMDLANNLNFIVILHVCSYVLAAKLTGKSPIEMGKILGIEDDFTKEERDNFYTGTTFIDDEEQ